MCTMTQKTEKGISNFDRDGVCMNVLSRIHCLQAASNRHSATISAAWTQNNLTSDYGIGV